MEIQKYEWNLLSFIIQNYVWFSKINLDINNIISMETNDGRHFRHCYILISILLMLWHHCRCVLVCNAQTGSEPSFAGIYKRAYTRVTTDISVSLPYKESNKCILYTVSLQTYWSIWTTQTNTYPSLRKRVNYGMTILYLWDFRVSSVCISFNGDNANCRILAGRFALSMWHFAKLKILDGKRGLIKSNWYVDFGWVMCISQRT